MSAKSTAFFHARKSFLLLLLPATVLSVLHAAPTQAGTDAFGDKGGHQYKLVKTVEDKKSLDLKNDADSVGPDATLPAPGGGTITWNVSSRLNLYETFFGDRGAGCDDAANTSAIIEKLYLQRGELLRNGIVSKAVTDFNKSVTRDSDYIWSSPGVAVDPVFVDTWVCNGIRHTAQASSISAISTLNTSVTAQW